MFHCDADGINKTSVLLGSWCQTSGRIVTEHEDSWKPEKRRLGGM